MPKVKVNDIEMYYEIHGEGPKLLYISGTGGDLRRKPNVFDSQLADHFTILAFDQRGLGQTSKPDKRYTMADYADDAAKLMETQGWSIAKVLGVSFGGMVAQEFAIRYPEKIEKLVLACTCSGGEGGASYPLHENIGMPFEAVAKLMIGFSDNRHDEVWRRDNPEEYQEVIDSRVIGLRDSYGEAGSEKRTGITRQLEARRDHDTCDRLHGLRMPTLISGGRYDGVSPSSNLEALHGLIPSSRLELFEGGHGFLGQDPRAYEVIIDFLKS